MNSDQRRRKTKHPGVRRTLLTVFCALVAPALMSLGCSSAVSSNGSAGPTSGGSDEASQHSDEDEQRGELRGDASAGQVHYEDQCASCHGDEGAGDGPAGAAFDMPEIADEDFMKEISDEHLYDVIHDGKGHMPGFGEVFSDDEIYDLIAYVRTLAE